MGELLLLVGICLALYALRKASEEWIQDRRISRRTHYRVREHYRVRPAYRNSVKRTK